MKHLCRKATRALRQERRDFRERQTALKMRKKELRLLRHELEAQEELLQSYEALWPHLRLSQQGYKLGIAQDEQPSEVELSDGELHD